MTGVAVRRHVTGLLACVVLAVGLSACEKTRELAKEMYQRAGGQVPASSASVAGSKKQLLRFDLLEQLERCEVRHRGLFIDSGSRQSDAHRPFTPGPFEDLRRVQRGGVSSAELLLPRVTYDFFLDKPAHSVALTVKGVQGSSSHLTGYIDGKRVGAARLGRRSARVSELGALGGELAAGRHTLELKLSGRGVRPGEVKASLQWLRIHFASDRDLRYPAPSWNNLVVDAALSDVPRRAIALRAPGSVRCGLVPVAGTRVRTDVGYWGEGRGVATVRARTADGKVVTLAEQPVEGGEDARWIALDMTLDAFAEQLVALEFAATEGEVGGRVLFGEPRLERKAATKKPRRSNVAVLVVLGGLDRRLIPPWGPREGMPALFEVAQLGVVFEGYRASATNVNGIMASLLSGARPAAHGVTFAGAGLHPDVPLLSEAVRKRDGRAAFFTNVPYSFEAFGFDRGWDRFAAYSPVEDRPGSEPILHGRDWVKQELASDRSRPKLLVMHLSGGHPPWDVTPEEARMLPPEDYNGIVEPRRGAMALRDVRQRSRASRRMLGPNDWLRVEALQVAALQKLDAALGALIDELKRRGVWEDALFAVVGDVGMGDRSGVPFSPIGTLEEARLSVPLIVKFPGPRPAQPIVRQLVNTEAIASTVAGVLGVRSELLGDAQRLESLLEPPSVLRRGASVARKAEQYVLYLGRYRLAGRLGAMPTLCDLEVDPTCRFDLAPEQPFIVQWMWRVGLPEFTGAAGEERLPAVTLAEPDARTQNALSVYGL